MFPVRIFDTLLFGLIVSSSLVLCLAVNAAVQTSRVARPSNTRAFKLRSKPRFLMLPMLVVTRFDRLQLAHTGTVKTRSVVFLVYQSMEPLNRWFEKPKSRPALNALVFSQWMDGSTALGRIVVTNTLPN